MTMTVASRRISWASASLSAWRIDFCGIFRLLIRRVDVGQELRRVGRRSGAGARDGAVDQRGYLGVDRVQRVGFEQRCLADAGAKMLQAVAVLAQDLDLVFAAIELRIA